jgi:hypothetical protein
VTELPPPGAYAIDDPYEPWRVSCWTVDDVNALAAWPVAARGKRGPQRPPRTTPGGSLEQRREAMAAWRAEVEAYRLTVIAAIGIDPEAAAARFVRETERCPRCLSVHRAADEEPLTREQRQAMVADLRRAGHPEALIATALGTSAKTVNRDARRAGIGTPLRTQRGTEAAGRDVAVTPSRDSPGRDSIGQPVDLGRAVAAFPAAVQGRLE